MKKNSGKTEFLKKASVSAEGYTGCHVHIDRRFGGLPGGFQADLRFRKG
jgi:hypothetical protein